MDPVKYTRQEYREEYLKSEDWKSKRAAALKRAKGCCEKCGKRKRLDIHHCNYRNLYDVLPDDLIALCRPCHELIELAKDRCALRHQHTRQNVINFKKEYLKFGRGEGVLSDKWISRLKELTPEGIGLIKGMMKSSTIESLKTFTLTAKQKKRVRWIFDNYQNNLQL